MNNLSPALPVPAARRAAWRSPGLWIGAGALALCGVAGAAYLAGRSATHAEPPPTPALVESGPAPQAPAKEAPRSAEATPACATCGVVESVRAVTRKGEGTGVGAVAGGVVGGLIGHQMGAGQGNTAMTVLGAVGGGLAGHEVEKRARSTTVYQVRVRTETGTMRTFEQSTAPAVGQRVRIEGQRLRLLSAEG